jgi:hypothetical protein
VDLHDSGMKLSLSGLIFFPLRRCSSISDFASLGALGGSLLFLVFL